MHRKITDSCTVLASGSDIYFYFFYLPPSPEHVRFTCRRIEVWWPQNKRKVSQDYFCYVFCLDWWLLFTDVRSQCRIKRGFFPQSPMFTCRYTHGANLTPGSGGGEHSAKSDSPKSLQVSGAYNVWVNFAHGPLCWVLCAWPLSGAC